MGDFLFEWAPANVGIFQVNHSKIFLESNKNLKIIRKLFNFEQDYYSSIMLVYDKELVICYSGAARI